MDEIKDILRIFQSKIQNIQDKKSLEKLRIEILGKNGYITTQMKRLRDLEESQKKDFGIFLNSLKFQMIELLKNRSIFLDSIRSFEASGLQETIDLTIPVKDLHQGSIHPTTQVIEELINIFIRFGFIVETGPSIENDWYNFTALNIDENHPAKQMQDTFYLKSKDLDNKKLLLRTHTSPVQIRCMEKKNLPIRLLSPGRTYRADSDSTHTPMFHQMEGLIVEKNVNMSHLKYIVVESIKDFFETSDIEIRFRPSFFPFTEPSAEVDIKLPNSNKWLEVLGCGVVHPKVLENVGIDNNNYRGIAFGLGVERFLMLKYNLNDLRTLFEGDFRWIKHYNFATFDIPTILGGLSK